VHYEKTSRSVTQTSSKGMRACAEQNSLNTDWETNGINSQRSSSGVLDDIGNRNVSCMDSATADNGSVVDEEFVSQQTFCLNICVNFLAMHSCRYSFTYGAVVKMSLIWTSYKQVLQNSIGHGVHLFDCHKAATAVIPRFFCFRRLDSLSLIFGF
jgi:hypothetical protein